MWACPLPKLTSRTGRAVRSNLLGILQNPQKDFHYHPSRAAKKTNLSKKLKKNQQNLRDQNYKISPIPFSNNSQKP